MAVTHLLDEIPTEIHVFNVYASGLPVFVMTRNGRIFAIEVNGGLPRARLIQQKP